MSRYINPGDQYFDNSGNPLAGGVLKFYESGTNTPLIVYSDSAETIIAGSEITLNAAGRVPNIFYTGTARVILEDSDGVQIFDRDPVGGESQFNNFSVWDNSVIYQQYDIVRGSNGLFYESIQNENQGNNPTDNPLSNTAWKEVQLVNIWNTNINYPVGYILREADRLYVSLISNNQGNQPSTDGGANWQDFGQSIRLPYSNTSSALTAQTVQAAIDELKNLLDNLPSSVVYKGQLDVSAGDAALPASPSNGDLYIISVGGTITVSSAGGAPAATAVSPGDQIIYNGGLSQWDLTGAVTQAASVSYNNATSGLAATNVQDAIDEVDSDVDALETILGSLTVAEMQQIANINSTTISTAQWGYLGSQDQATSTTSDVTFNDIDASGNVEAGGHVSSDNAAYPTAAAGVGNLVGTSAEGAALYGQGSLYDTAAVNSLGIAIWGTPTGTQNIYHLGSMGIRVLPQAFAAYSVYGLGTTGSTYSITAYDSVGNTSFAVRDSKLVECFGALTTVGTITAGNNILFGADNTYSIGTASFRASDVFAGNGTINTSDENLKTDIEQISDIEKEALLACQGLIGKYQMLDSIERKGADNARWHFGLGAQSVIAEFENRGLDWTKYSFICRDDIPVFETQPAIKQQQATETLTRPVKKIEVIDGTPTLVKSTEEYQSPVVEHIGVVDENGAPVLNDKGEQLTYPVPVMVDVEIEKQVQVGTTERYGIRYEHLYAGILAAMKGE